MWYWRMQKRDRLEAIARLLDDLAADLSRSTDEIGARRDEVRKLAAEIRILDDREA